MASTPVLPKLVGQRVKRREDPRLIQGQGTYVDDVKLVGLRHLAFKRSDVAHGRIQSVDVGAAREMDGVDAVFTGAEIAGWSLDQGDVGTSELDTVPGAKDMPVAPAPGPMLGFSTSMLMPSKVR